MEYAIYVRKSSDEKTWKQVQSIPDQVMSCLSYAKGKDLKLKKRDHLFTPFQDKKSTRNMDDPMYAETREEIEKYFIVTEDRSARTAWNRPKWADLVRLVKKKKIKGIISYSPDRQSRNAIESGEIIDLIDKDLVEMKYPTFHFENNASGKMMLWIFLTMSKQFSDKLSEDIHRGIKSKIQKGLARWVSKWGYLINEEWYHEPDERNFGILKEWFRKRVEQNLTVEEIYDFLIEKDFRVVKVKGEETDPSLKQLYNVLLDPFYFGLYNHGQYQSDLTVSNPFFIPMITKEEHQILYERYTKNLKGVTKTNKFSNYELMPLEAGLLTMEDWSRMTFNLPNKKRLYKKLDFFRESCPVAQLEDVVESHQIKYTCKNQYSEFNKYTVSFDKIEKEVVKVLNELCVHAESFKDLLPILEEEQETLNQRRKDEVKVLKDKIRRSKQKKYEFIQKNMWFRRDEEDEAYYQQKKNEMNQTLMKLEVQLKELESYQWAPILEMKSMVFLVENAAEIFSSRNYVRKRKITEMIFSNITLTSENELKACCFPWLTTVLSWEFYSVADGQNCFEHRFHQRDVFMPQLIVNKRVRHYFSHEENQVLLESLSKKTKEYYEIS